MSKNNDHGDDLLCSFCGKSQEEVKKLIAGPSVYICDECIQLCNEIIDEEYNREREEGEPDELLKPAIARIPTVEQPLLRYIDDTMWAEVLRYINTGKHYRSVSNLQIQDRQARPDASLS